MIALRGVRGEVMGLTEVHLCDLVEGKRFIHFVSKWPSTYFPLANDVKSS